MANNGNHLERRQYRRFDVNLSGALVSPSYSVPVKVLDLSIGGALVRTYVPITANVDSEINLIEIDNLGSWNCKITLKRDQYYHLAFSQIVGGVLTRYLDDLAQQSKED